ncbi:MAG: hypothetical protein ACOC0Z_05045, partial [Halohasta sp.]
VTRLGTEMHIQRSTKSPFGQNSSSRRVDESLDATVDMLTNGGVDLEEESLREALADLDHTSILKKMLLSGLETSLVARMLLTGVDEVHGQLSGRDPTPEETLQNRLGQVEFPKQWMDDLEAMGPPEGWKTELKAYAENAVKSATSGEHSKF